jgi:methionyl-tRNA formyltransferase
MTARYPGKRDIVSAMPKPLSITVLVDNPNSWIIPYVKRLIGELESRGHNVFFCNTQEEIREGEVAFLLSCEKIVPEAVLGRNKHNIVIHPSALPEGRGFSPLSWQILEGKNDIPISLFEAVSKVDTGAIYEQRVMHFEGHELNEELKAEQGETTIAMALGFIDSYPPREGRLPVGTGAWYKRRSAKDSALDPDKTITEQFDLLRIVDNKRYPAFFTYRGHTYILRIEKKTPDADA